MITPVRIAIIFFSLYIASSSFFVVEQRENAIVFLFGEAKRIINKPGLYFKVPYLNDVRYFDKRILQITNEARELTAADEKRIIVDAYAKYRITDTKRFYQTVGTLPALQSRLSTVLESALREVIGRVSLTELLSPERSQIMREIKRYVKNTSEVFGIEIIDVRILRTDLPDKNSAAIYQRMKTDREKEAKQIRAEGNEESEIIKSQANKEAQVIRAEAYQKAKEIRAQGDSKAAEIYNAAFSKDPEFYDFKRHLETYEKSFKSKDTIFVLSPKSELLKYLKMGK